MSRPGYNYLTTYVFSTVIYDLVCQFCKQFITSYRQTEQMTQAGRSGKSKQISALTEKFAKEGGFRENLFKKRMAEKKKQK